MILLPHQYDAAAVYEGDRHPLTVNDKGVGLEQAVQEQGFLVHHAFIHAPHFGLSNGIKAQVAAAGFIGGKVAVAGGFTANIATH